MSTIMIIDDMAVFREPIAASLGLAGFKTVCASTSSEAIQKLSIQTPDVILLDLAMPLMDGLTLLALIRGKPATRNVRVIVLTGSCEKEKILQAGRLGVKDYLLKSRFSLRELIERIRKYCPVPNSAPEQSGTTQFTPAKPSSSNSVAAPTIAAAAGLRSTPLKTISPSPELPVLLTRDDCLNRTKDALRARTLSGVVAQVIGLAASPRTDLSDLAGLIAKDVVLSARVLQVANSAAYATSCGLVTTLGDAVRHIGCTAIRNIAAAMGVFDVMPDSAPDGFNPIRCWQHSFGMATLCEQFASELPDSLGGSAYLAGLCHDLGEILFYTHFGKEYQEVLKFEAQTGKSREFVEHCMLGTTRGELAMVVLQSLGLPASIQRPIELFHGSHELRSDGDGRLARVLRLAEVTSNAMLLASGPGARVAPVSRAECKLAIGKAAPTLADGDTIRAEVFTMTTLLARLSSRDQQSLLRPLFDRANVRMLLARDTLFSSCDPVTTMFQAMASVRAMDRLPQDEAEFGDAQALVVVARSPSTAGFTEREIARALAIRRVPVIWIVQQAEKSGSSGVGDLSPCVAPITLQMAADFVERVARSKQAAGENDDSPGVQQAA